MTVIVKNTTFQGINVVFDSHGVGDEALVFIHGWSCSRTLWAAQSPLYENHRSILIDLPGHGESDSPQIDYHIELFARAVGAVIEHEEIKKVVLIAHSMGGPVATMFVRLFDSSDGLNISGIVYVDSFLHLPESYMTVQQRQELRDILLTDDQAFIATINRLFTTDSSEDVRQNVLRVMLATPRHVRAAATTSMALPHTMAYDEVYQHIPAINITAPNCHPAHGHWFHHFPRLEIRAMTGVSHWLFMEKPEEFNMMIDSFLRETSYIAK